MRAPPWPSRIHTCTHTPLCNLGLCAHKRFCMCVQACCPHIQNCEPRGRPQSPMEEDNPQSHPSTDVPIPANPPSTAVPSIPANSSIPLSSTWGPSSVAPEEKRLSFIQECLASTVERLKEAEKEVEQMQDSECSNGCYPACPCPRSLRLDLRRAKYVSLTACGYVYVPQWSCNDCHEAIKPDFIDLGLFPGTMMAC